MPREVTMCDEPFVAAPFLDAVCSRPDGHHGPHAASLCFVLERGDHATSFLTWNDYPARPTGVN